MRSFLFTLSILLLASAAFAQQRCDPKKHNKAINASPIVLHDDTLYSYGKPYAIMKEMAADPNHPDYSIRNLNNDEIIFIKYEVPSGIGSFGSYRVKFKESGNEVKIKTKEEKELPALIISNELVDRGISVKKEREESFITNNGGTLKSGAANEDKFRMVTRNRTAAVIIVGDNITQDTNNIGNYKESGTYINKIFTKQLSVFLPSGQKIAEAQYAEEGANAATVMTAKDGKQQTITINPAKNARKQVVEWLVENNYL